MHHATFVLSTGRCGTQWLTEVLRAACGPQTRVEHEPLHNGYDPRRMLGASDPSSAGGRCARRLLEHVSDIEKELAWRNYIETGHPSWGALPWLLRHFAGRVRVIHLVRHPVPVACSWLSHRAFSLPLLPIEPVKELLTPMDRGVAFPEYRGTWEKLTPFEKCLYYWAEVNALGLRLQRENQAGWLRVTYESLFAQEPSTLEQISSFVGLPNGAAGNLKRGERIDEHRFVIDRWPDLEAVARHPRIIEIAQQLGYDPRRYDEGQLRTRFSVAIT